MLDLEMLQHLEKINPVSLAILVVGYAIGKIPLYSLKKSKQEAEAREQILVHLNAEVEKLTKQLAKVNDDLIDYRKRFFKLEEEHAKLKIEHDSLAMRYQNLKSGGPQG